MLQFFDKINSKNGFVDMHIHTNDSYGEEMLKIKDNLIDKPLGINAYKVFSSRVKAQIFFEKVESEADKAAKEAQIKLLKASIERREKTISNGIF